MKTILFPTDFSEGGNNAFNYALNLSEKMQAKIILFNSFHVPAHVDTVSIGENKEEELMSAAEEKLFEMESRALMYSKNTEIKCMVKYGLAMDNIISIAQEKNVDLIVMGTKGAHGLKETLLGSNAAAVLERACCPVLAVPEEARFKNIDKIVFATNFMDSDFHSIAVLTEIGAIFNSEIMIVHVAQVAPTQDYERDLLQWYKGELKKKINTDLKNFTFHDPVGGNVDYELEDFIQKNNADLLSLSMRKRNIFSKFFEKSLTKKMMYHTHIPLLGFHHAKGVK